MTRACFYLSAHGNQTCGLTLNANAFVFEEARNSQFNSALKVIRMHTATCYSVSSIIVVDRHAPETFDVDDSRSPELASPLNANLLLSCSARPSE
mmetsp:Transcript_18188/g.46570  ORF Transcript_18188/g.46570 Transcript_18188/m.46570 type:complete len:95 (+) Transcript_18188:109-393(+)